MKQKGENKKVKVGNDATGTKIRRRFWCKIMFEQTIIPQVFLKEDKKVCGMMQQELKEKCD